MKKTAFLLLIVFIISCISVSAEPNFVEEVIEESDCSNRMAAQAIEVIEVEDTSENVIYNEFLYLESMDNNSSYNDYYGFQTVKAYGEKVNSNLTGLYVAIATALKSRQPSVDISAYDIIDSSEVRMTYQAVLGDNPEIYYVTNSYRLYYRPTMFNTLYTKVEFSYLDYIFDDELFEKKAEEILKKSGARKSMSDFDKALLIHDALVDHITYKVEYKDDNANVTYLDSIFPLVHTAYGAIVDGDAVCDGYSKSYQYLLKKVGVLSHIALGVNHAWNLVEIDGEWYYTDLTWNDRDIVYAEGRKPIYYYDFFNITTQRCVESNHIFDSPYELPYCTATKNNYHVKNNMVYETLDVKEIAKQLEKGLTVRIYVNGDINSAYQWASQNAQAIAKEASFVILGGGVSRTNNEVIINYIAEKIEINKNLHLTIGSSKDRTVNLYKAFYNKKGKLVNIDFEEDVKLTKFSNTYFKLNTEGFTDDYKYIKVLVWDENGYTPVYTFERLDY